MRKVVGTFLGLLMFVCCLPTTLAENSNIIVLNTDTETKGSWTQIYGKSGYQIFYGDTEETTGKNNTAQHITDIPEYAQIKVTTPGFSYNVSQNPSEDERALLMPEEEGYVKRAISTYNYNKNSINIKIMDGNAHIVSFYVASFASDYNRIYYKVTDANGNLIDTQDFNYSDGTYINVCADSEFNFEIGEYDTGAKLGVNAIFFDELTENNVMNFTATTGSVARTINLDWNSEKAVNIYRKSEKETSYKLIAENISANVHTDKELDSGTTYSYQLRELNGRLCSKEIALECSTKEYQKINLSAESENSTNFENFGDKTTITIKAIDDNGKPISGLQVSAFFDDTLFYLAESDKLIAQIMTDTEGIARFEFTAEYYGNYSIKIVSSYDDERELASGETLVSVSLKAGEHKTVPYLNKISEEISPGEIFNIYGEGIKGDNVEIKAFLSGETPIALEILQKDMSEYGYYVTTRLPQNAQAGIYDVWVKNDYGWSEPIKLNSAIALFTDEYEIYKGLDVRVVGRNFDGSMFGLSNEPRVRLVNENGDDYSATILESNRVMLRFTVDETVPAGKYTVQVSNAQDGVWSSVESGQTLTVLASHTDPLGIGVPWTNIFNWKNYYAKDFGIIPGNDTDLSSMIDSATITIEKNGGGVLNFEEGTYNISFIQLRKGVVLNGAGKDKTIFNRLAIEDNRFAMRTSSTAKASGIVGVANLTLYAESDSAVPSEFWINLDGNDKSCSNIFVYNTDINIGDDCSNYDDAVSIIGLTERLLISGCNMDGIPTSGYVRRYGKYLNNDFNYIKSAPALFAEYSTIENNKVINPQVVDGNVNTSLPIHGFSIKGNTYFAGNEIVLGLHPNNEGRGEVVMLEPPKTYFACGKVINSDSNTIKIYGHEHMMINGELVLPTPKYGELCIVIAGGKGMGQVRRVVGNEGNHTLIINEPWDILPDASSTYAIMVAFENTTIYNNKALECESSISFYSNCFNCTAIENELDTTGGISVNSFHDEDNERISPVYHIRIEDNKLSNYIEHDKSKGMSSTGQRAGDDVQYIGIEIKNNQISNAENYPLYQGETGTRIRLTGGSVGYDYNALGTIVDSNTYTGFDTPILLENVSGVVLNNNKFIDCGTTFITETNSDNILYLGEKAGTLYFVDNQVLMDNVYHRTNIINETGREVSGKLFIAVYNNQGALKKIVIKDVTIQKNSQLSEDITLSGNDILEIDEGDTVNTFLWSDLVNLMPLSEKGTIIIK